MKQAILTVTFLVVVHSLCSQDTVKISPDLEMIRISQNAYIHISYSNLPGYGRVPANGLVYTDKHSAFLFDTPWNESLTEELVTYMEERMGLKLKGFVPNHWHEDCMGGLGYLKSRNIRSYANELTFTLAREKGLPVPDRGFRDSLTLKIGGKYIHCYFPGAAHSTDNIVVWIPSEKILFPGCIIKSIDSRNLGNTADGDLSEYPKTVEWIIRKFDDAVTVIPGHGSYGGPELLTHTLSLASGR
ncbi:MAG: subclass B1 metallo-beta-lactamase [Bacteroidales bacterium]